jgi:hypothetical protein
MEVVAGDIADAFQRPEFFRANGALAVFVLQQRRLRGLT